MSETTLTTKTERPAERFTNKVLVEFNTYTSGDLQITEKQRGLIKNYFIGIDRALKLAEDNRLKKSEKYRDSVSVTWDNVNLQDLVMKVMHYSKIGLDILQDNFLFAIPYKNKKTGLYDVNLMKGYNGVRFISEKYAIEKPLNVTIELVYANDNFKPIKKSHSSIIESYEFEIKSPFNRGAIIGGFGYIEYNNATKNKLIIMTLEEILKRKPTSASAEFWGGEKDKWEDGQKVGKETIDGWHKEMCFKTLIREVYSTKNIPIDPNKIDDSYNYIKSSDQEMTFDAIESQVISEIDQNSNRQTIDFIEEKSATTIPDEELIEKDKVQTELEAGF